MPSLLITGVSSGIGRATAERFAREGWRVTGTVRDVERERTASRAPAPLPPEVALRPLDQTDPASVAALAQAVLSEDGPPDVLINNAGQLHFGSVEDTDLTVHEHLFAVNVFGPLALTKAFLPAMRARGSGTIVNVTSLGGRLVFPFFAAYNATKHAMEGYTEGLWHELRPFGIKVKAVEPGFVATPIWDKADVDMETAGDASAPYRPYMRQMAAFERDIKRRSSPQQTADEIWDAVNDDADRLRYPVAAYAKPVLGVQRLLGAERVAKFMHDRWMGKAEER